jgi:hypothetical protein
VLPSSFNEFAKHSLFSALSLILGETDESGDAELINPKSLFMFNV